MVTDAYSKKIMGYTISDNMETQSVIEAYRMALKNKVNKSIETIHHSDRGLQYCSKEYIELSLNNNCKISMTENGDPYENALAERMNRTIKEEFGLGATIKSKLMAKLLMDEAVLLYNEYRPHLSLNYKTPNEVYKKSLTTS
jgi:transposase InsO family protein